MLNNTAVVGIGNLFLQDDGAGIHAVRKLKEKYCSLPVDFIEAGTAAFGLYDLIKSYDKVFFIDAVIMGKEPGTIGKFSAKDAVSLKKSFSLHDMGLAEVIKLGQALGDNFDHITIFGIQPGKISFGDTLSAIVESRLDDLINNVAEEV